MSTDDREAFEPLSEWKLSLEKSPKDVFCCGVSRAVGAGARVAAAAGASQSRDWMEPSSRNDVLDFEIPDLDTADLDGERELLEDEERELLDLEIDERELLDLEVDERELLDLEIPDFDAERELAERDDLEDSSWALRAAVGTPGLDDG